MEFIAGSIRRNLTQILSDMAQKLDFIPSWFWIYEPEKPDLLKNK